MYCYLLHFEQPISPKHTCQHYIGWCTDLHRRMAEHRAGTAARLTEVAKERGIGFTVARVWKGDRQLERRLKNQKSGPRLCPICSGTQEVYERFTLDDVEAIAF